MTKQMKLFLCLGVCGLAIAAHADDSKFTLEGPRINVYVTRGGVTLPIAQVPNLLPQDKLRVRMDLPATQANHLLLIVVFLRSSTNEPPDSWFTRIETWKVNPPEGTTVIVPDGAQRALLFVAPETGGDFATLRSAVKGSPGTFLMAAATLDKGSYDAQRITRYLAGMQNVASSDAAAIHARSTDLAVTLALKPNLDCFKQPVADQVDCLTAGSTPLLLDDGHAQTITDTISSGASSNFINEAATADGGVYSAYVGTLVDLVHMVELMRTAKYRYIPAIAAPQGAALNLMLNAAPSFNDPKSVIVIGLPSIQSALLPRFTLADPAQVFCLPDPGMSIPLRGAPQLFATGFAHDLTLNLDVVNPRPISLVAVPGAGGLIRSGDAPIPSRQARPQAQNAGSPGPGLGPIVQGTLHGYWGFDRFDGPALRFQRTAGGPWKLAGADALEAGRNADIMLQGSGSACIDQIALLSPSGAKQELPLNWSTVREGLSRLPLNLPLRAATPGTYALIVQEKGSGSPVRIAVAINGSATILDRLLLNPITTTSAQLVGTGLAEVVSLRHGEQIFLPNAAPDHGHLTLRSSGLYESTNLAQAIATLKNGRSLPVPVAMEGPENILELIRVDATPALAAGELSILLDSETDLPLDGTLRFVVQSMAAVPHGQTIELATANGSAQTSLSLHDGSLILQDEHTIVASLDLLKAFGQSGFGELRLRGIGIDGSFGDWITVGNLVRRPHIKAILCTRAKHATCRIEGKDLFLALAFSATKDFAAPSLVPDGFDDPVLIVTMASMPQDRRLFVKLRDGSNVIATIQVVGKH
jgi:hypothetical protein